MSVYFVQLFVEQTIIVLVGVALLGHDGCWGVLAALLIIF